MKRGEFALALALSAAPMVAVAATVSAPAPAIKATRLSGEQVKLGVPFTDEVVISGGAHDGWHANDLAKDSPFTLLGQSEADSGGDAVVTLRLGLYALGEHPLPDITLVSSAGSNSGAKLVVPGEAKITGSPALAKGDSKLRGLAGPRVPLVLDPIRVALALGAALLTLALLLLAGRFIARRIRNGASQERRDRRTLDALLRSRCDDREFYLVLDGIVRRHLERAHEIPAMERTAAELSELVAAVPALPCVELALLFREANLVKFAGRAAGPGRRDADGQLTVRLLADKAREDAKTQQAAAGQPPRTTPDRRGSHAAPSLS
jgi:hypothetical protein